MTHLNLDNSLDMLLIGRTGDGKSATGNTILGRKSFKDSCGVVSKTFESKSDYSECQGRIIKVVDTPGLGDTQLNQEADLKQFSNAINTAIGENPKGYHAILYVMRFGNRFCKEDNDTIQLLKKVLGDDFIKKHAVFVFTCGDNFDTDPGIVEKNLSFDDWIKKQKNDGFQKFIDECQRRVILFDNRTRDLKKQTAQKEKLIRVIETLSTKGKRYTNENFEKAEKKRQELIANLGQEQEKQNVIDKIGILTAQVKNAEMDYTGIETLQKISEDIQALHKDTEVRAKTNKKLKDTLKLFQNIQKALEAKKQEISKNISIQEKKEQCQQARSKLDDTRTNESVGKTSAELDEVNKRLKEQEQALKKREEEIRKLEEDFKKLSVKESALKVMEDLEKTYVEVKNSKDSESLIKPIIDYAVSAIPYASVLSSAYNWWMGK